jgi:hypothetical protein
MELYLDLDRRKLEAASATGFNTHPGSYSVSSEPKQAGRLVEKEFFRAAAIVHALYSSATILLLLCTCYKDFLVDSSRR